MRDCAANIGLQVSSTIKKCSRKEDHMAQALPAVQLLFYTLGGLGLLFTGIGML
jgi:hypothetical protein